MKIKTPQELKEQMQSEVLVRYKHQIEETQRCVLDFVAAANDSAQYKRMAEDARFTFAVDSEEHAKIVASALRDAGWCAVDIVEGDCITCVQIFPNGLHPRSAPEEPTINASGEPTITLRFETKEQREAFAGWFLDAGGEQDMFQYADEHNEDCPNDTRWDLKNGIISFSRIDE